MGFLSKRGQITLFIIIAIIMLGLIMVFVSFKEDILKKSEEYPKEISQIRDYLLNCLKETGENSLIKIGEQGGYFFISEDIPKTSSGIPFLLYNDYSYLLTKEQIEQQISGSINEEINFCILNFKDFKKIIINFSDHYAMTSISENHVALKLYYPLTIYFNEKYFYLNKIETIDIDLRFEEIYEAAKLMLDERKESEKEVCLSCIYSIASNSNLSVSIMDYDNQSIIFSIKDFNSQLKNKEYEFNFAAK